MFCRCLKYLKLGISDAVDQSLGLIGGAIVGNDDLDIRIDLVDCTFKGLTQKSLCSIIGWNPDRNQRACIIVQFLFSLDFQTKVGDN